MPSVDLANPDWVLRSSHLISFGQCHELFKFVCILPDPPLGWIFACVYELPANPCSCSSWGCTRGVSHREEGDRVGCAEHWVHLWASSGGLQARHLRCPMAGFLIVYKTVRPEAFDEFWALVAMLPVSSNSSAVLITSIFLVGWERSGPVGHHLAWLGKLASFTVLSLSPLGEITDLGALSWHWAVPPWGRSDMDEVKLFFLSFSMPLFSSFSPMMCWNFSADSWTPTKLLLSVGGCQGLCSVGAWW